jgi:hypothetical protein
MRTRRHSGRWLARALNGTVAFDPRRTQPGKNKLT